MMNKEIQTLINNLVSKIVELIAPDKIILFGSASYGKMHPNKEYKNAVQTAKLVVECASKIISNQ